MKEKGEVRVVRGEATLVRPAEETQKGIYFLSNLDQNVAVPVRTVYFYKREEGEEEGEEEGGFVRGVKDSLALALVHYYPLSGRLVISDEGKLAVDCKGEGAVFVEAEALCSMEEMGELSDPNSDTLALLVPDIPPPSPLNILLIPPLLVQVTKFKGCGGVSVGLCMNHCMFDGIAAMEFVKSWGEITRGLPISTPPYIHRKLLSARVPPRVSFPHHEFCEIADTYNTLDSYEKQEIVHKSFLFSPHHLNSLKQKASSSGSEKKYTSFEALSAFVWRSRTRALEMRGEQKTKLLFAVDGRRRLVPEMPKGYFGNAIALTYSVCEAGELGERDLEYGAGLVREGVEMMSDEYIRSAIDYFEVARGRPSLRGTLVITAWSRLQFEGADFGWGAPRGCGPVGLPEKEVALFLPGGANGGVNVLLGLPLPAMQIFQETVLDFQRGCLNE